MRRWIVIFMLLPIYSNAQIKREEDRIYEFLNQFFDSIPIYVKYYTDKEHAYFTLSAEFRYIDASLFKTKSKVAFDINRQPEPPFSFADSVAIVKDLNRYKRTGFKFDKSKLTYRKFVPDSAFYEGVAVKDSSWLWFQIHRNGMSISSISVPIFFDNYQKAIFYYGGSNNVLAGNDVTALFRKIKGRWTQINVLNEWVK